MPICRVHEHNHNFDRSAGFNQETSVKALINIWWFARRRSSKKCEVDDPAEVWGNQRWRAEEARSDDCDLGGVEERRHHIEPFWIVCRSKHRRQCLGSKVDSKGRKSRRKESTKGRGSTAKVEGRQQRTKVDSKGRKSRRTELTTREEVWINYSRTIGCRSIQVSRSWLKTEVGASLLCERRETQCCSTVISSSWLSLL